MKNLLIIILFVVLTVFNPTISFAQERIILFDSEIQINKNASAIVKETITVQADGINIKRGIYRDIPIRYSNKEGLQYKIGFNLLSVKKNGKDEEYRIDSQQGGSVKRIYIGNKDIFLPKGVYTYEIVYKVNRVFLFNEDTDEFYWNVTGNEWLFPIEKARARIILPENAKITEFYAYTGAVYSKAQNYVSYISKDSNSIEFNTNKPLKREQGLTIAVSWPVGFMDRPSSTDKATYIIRDNIMSFLWVLFFIGLNVYYYRIWREIGDDPDKGTIIPILKPPADLSPGVMNYIYSMGLDFNERRNAFSAALVNIAVKGIIRITYKSSKTYKIKQLSDDYTLLSRAEKAMMHRMFSTNSKTFTISKKYNLRFVQAIDAFADKIEKENKDLFFKENKGYFEKPYWVSIIFLILSLWIIDNITDYIVFSILGIALTHLVYFYIMKSRTKHGRKIMDEIEGFKLYLETAEGDRLNVLHPPKMNIELFEEYLPYAIALNVENKWSKNFKKSMPKVEMDNYQPTWYHSNHTNMFGNNKFSCVRMSKNLGSTLISTSRSAYIDPASSSGNWSSGGGFSGGGFGGGGGGGW